MDQRNTTDKKGWYIEDFHFVLNTCRKVRLIMNVFWKRFWIGRCKHFSPIQLIIRTQFEGRAMFEKYAIVLCAPVALANYILQTFFSEKTQTKLSHHVLKDSYTSFLMKYFEKSTCSYEYDMCINFKNTS